MNSKLLKRRAIVITVIPVLIVGALVYRALGSNSKPTYNTAKVERGMIVASVSASGQITPTNNVGVTTQATGIVKKIYVKEGDTVKAGDKLFEIDLDQNGQLAKAKAWAAYLSAKSELDAAQQNKISSNKSIKQANIDLTTAQQNKLSLQQALEQAQADLAGAQNAFNAVQNNPPDDLDRQQKALALQAAQDAVTLAQQKYNSADAAIDNAELGVTMANQAYSGTGDAIEKAQADVNSAWLSYQATLPTVVAPVDGKVGNLTLTVGMAITGSSAKDSVSISNSSNSGSPSNVSTSGDNGSSGTSSSGQAVATIVSNSNPIATFNLSEIDVVKVRPGQRATITLDAFPGKTFTGKVLSVDRNGVTSSGVTTYPVTIQFDTSPDDILPNMAANVSIITDTKDNVLLIPSGVAQTVGNQTVVKILKNGQIQQVPVELGLSSDTQVEVVSGLSKGDTIVLGTVSGSQQGSGSSPFSGNRGFGRGAMRIGSFGKLGKR